MAYTLLGLWADAWNTIIRKVIFKDEELKSLMKIPEGTGIIDFIDRYFIKAGYTSKLLKDEDVRITYSELQAMETNAPHVTKNMMSFDIYVRLTELHNVGKDRLQLRTNLIADRLAYLLTDLSKTEGYKFWVVSTSDLGTRTVDYARMNLTLAYMKAH